MDTTELNLRLPKSDVEFIRAYATQHQVSIEEAVDRALRLLRQVEQGEIHPEVEAVSGILPADIDVEDEYYDHLCGKHQ